MPTMTYPITVTTPIADKILEVEVLADISHIPTSMQVGLTIVNGSLVNELPFTFVQGAVDNNTLKITNLTSTSIFIIFSDSLSTDVQYLELDNAVEYDYIRTTDAPLLMKYNALHNFYDGSGNSLDDRSYNSPFRTTALNLTEKSVLDMKLQAAYDGSINIIFTDDSNPIRIVNSRFTVNETTTVATIIDRRARKDANTYNEEKFHQTELIPKAISIPTLTFNGLLSGGNLTGGGYKYYFKYVTADGAETDIIEESRLVSVHEGATTVNAVGLSGANTSNASSFTLTNLDQSFYGITVYFTIATGEVDTVLVAYKIDSPYIITNNATCNILHTGYETKTLIDISTLSLTYSLISRSKTLDVVNNRLIVGNTDSLDVYDEALAIAASGIPIYESDFYVVQHSQLDSSTDILAEQNYSNPKFIYDQLGYWKGETYELGVVFITNDGVSPVYPIQGIDAIDTSLSGWGYNNDMLGGLYTGFSAFGQNALGVYRTNDRKDLWHFDYVTNELSFIGTNLMVDITNIGKIEDPTKRPKGFFFVRRPRKKDCLLQGLITPVATVPVESKFGSEYEISGFGNWCGLGLTSTPAKGNVKFVPAPKCIMPFGVEEVATSAMTYTPMLDAAGADVKTVGAVVGSTVVLTSVEGLDAGDSVKFAGYSTGTISYVTEGSNSITLIGAPMPAPVGGTLVSVGKKGSGISTDFYIQAPIKDYNLLKSWAFYSPDVDCASPLYASMFNGSKVGIRCTKQSFSTEQVNVTTGHEAPLNVVSPLYFRINGTISTYNSANELSGDKSAYASYVDTGAPGVAPKGFGGSIDRNLFCYWGKAVGASDFLEGTILSKISAATTEQFASGNPIGKEISYRPGSCLAYGKYVGLKLNGSVDEFQALNMVPNTEYMNTHALNSLMFTNNGWLKEYPDNIDDSNLGYVASIYSSPLGIPLTYEAWTARYLSDEDTEYVAISPRYRYSDHFTPSGEVIGSNVVPLYGGDCYIGVAWKQVYHPLGIIEAPQTNDINAYKTTRRSLGLLPYGLAIPIPAQSNYNFNIRSKERIDDREYKVYGTDRSFLPLRGKDLIRGNRQYETSLYNHGYNSQDKSGFNQFRLNVNAPFYRFQYPNRVYASNQSSENEFVNAFSIFKGLNYKDYNSDLGAITKIMSLNNVMILVFSDGVARVGIDERSMVSQDTGGIFVDNANVLSRSDVQNSSYGSSYLHSVCASNNFVYGVDFTRLKIWRTNGDKFEIISDLKIQNLLKTIQRNIITYSRFDASTDWIDIYSQFDSRKNELYFTFVTRTTHKYDVHQAIVYNETLQIWVCITDDNRKFIFESNEYRYSFPAISGIYNKIYRYQAINPVSIDANLDVFGEYNKFYGDIYDMSFDYHVIDEQALYKLFNNIYVIGNNSLPNSIVYSSDTNISTTQILTPYTNIRYPMLDSNNIPILVSGGAGTQILYLAPFPPQVNPSYRYLMYGDFISIIGDDAHDIYNFVVISYNGSVLIVDRQLPKEFTNKQLYYGYGSGIPMRLTDSSFEESYGVISCQFNKNIGINPTKLRGKWMRFSQTYKGTAPVYISGIITDYGVSLS